MIGPPGVRARPHPWWTPVRLALALAVVTYALCVLVKTPCATGGDDAGWWNTPADYANLCASDLPGAYTSTGLAEGVLPLSSSDGRFAVPVESAPEAVLGYGAATFTRVLHGWPDTDARAAEGTETVAESGEVRGEAVTYVAVSAVIQLFALLAAVGLLAGVVSAERRRMPTVTDRLRPDPTLRRLTPLVVSPLIVFAGLAGWDLVTVALVCGALWAWYRDREVLTGALIGLGTAMAVWPVVLLVAVVGTGLGSSRARLGLRAAGAALVVWVAVNVPAFVLSGGVAGEYLWSYLTGGIQDGSVWKVLETLGAGPGAHTLSIVVLTGWAVAGVAALAYGALRTRPVRPAALAFALLVLVLVLGTGYEPGYALWLLPLAVAASRTPRDVCVWQGAELFFVLATWWHLGGYSEGIDGGDPVYALAIGLRVVASLWLGYRVLAEPVPARVTAESGPAVRTAS